MAEDKEGTQMATEMAAEYEAKKLAKSAKEMESLFDANIEEGDVPKPNADEEAEE